ncbi:hypothetical protein [Modestobacter sp. URMC 112]
MQARGPVDDEGVRALAKAAGLPIPDERLPLVAAQLGEWLAAANDLNHKMSALEHLTVTPITVFSAPAAANEIAE